VAHGWLKEGAAIKYGPCLVAPWLGLAYTGPGTVPWVPQEARFGVCVVTGLIIRMAGDATSSKNVSEVRRAVMLNCPTCPSMCRENCPSEPSVDSRRRSSSCLHNWPSSTTNRLGVVYHTDIVLMEFHPSNDRAQLQARGRSHSCSSTSEGNWTAETLGIPSL
jgi:hypothetical protein